jgi:hypothetical protein
MHEYLRRVVQSTDSELFNTCELLSNAEVLRILLQSPPAASCSVQAFALTSCPLSLTQIATASSTSVAAKAGVVDPSSNSDEAVYWSSSLNAVDELVSTLVILASVCEQS